MSDSGQDWVWYGGRASLDFVNTRRDREVRPVEYLRYPGELAAWLAKAGLAAGAGLGTGAGPLATLTGLTSESGLAEVDAATFTDALALREDINALVKASVADTEAPEGAVHRVNQWLTAGPAAPVLRQADGRLLLESGPAQPGVRAALSAIALDAAQLVGSDQRGRLRICPGPHCGGRFLDRSAGGRRRWCSMAVCGNRQKVSSHRRAGR
jgi:predicted RNA-binding Zn ribbon-like protein